MSDIDDYNVEMVRRALAPGTISLRTRILTRCEDHVGHRLLDCDAVELWKFGDLIGELDKCPAECLPPVRRILFHATSFHEIDWIRLNGLGLNLQVSPDDSDL